MSLVQTLRFILQHPLNRNRPIRAVARFFAWQLRARISNKPYIFKWIHNARFLVYRGEAGLTGNLYAGLHEFADMAYVLHALRPQDLFVDVGANLGSYTILASAVVGAQSLAIEPIVHSYKRLCENLNLNQLETRAKSINKALGAESGRLAFTDSLDTVNHALAPNEDSDTSVEVEVTTLDELLQTRAPSMIKIDVEGFEAAVLKGANTVLQNPCLHSVIMELNGSSLRYGFNDQDIVSMMQNFGFKVCSYDPVKRDLTVLEKIEFGEGNMLFVRDLEFAKTRIREAPKFRIHGYAL